MMGVDPGADERTDEELLCAHCQGDDGAFAVLVHRHRDRLWALAVRTLRHHDDAADALQEALISAFRRASTFQGNSAVTTWLHRIVVNACLDRIRRNKVRAADALPEDADRHPSLAADGGPDIDAERSETRDEVVDALSRLNPDQRAALVLVDLEGYSVDEAAVMLGCAPGTVKSRCSRGRARLAPLLSHLRENS